MDQRKAQSREEKPRLALCWVSYFATISYVKASCKQSFKRRKNSLKRMMDGNVNLPGYD